MRSMNYREAEPRKAGTVVSPYKKEKSQNYNHDGGDKRDAVPRKKSCL